MYTSPEYILQCEKAVEIQQGWIPADWDYIGFTNSKEILVISGYETDGGFYGPQIDPYEGLEKGEQVTRENVAGLEDTNTIIWLPRQDQLQEMIGKSWMKVFDSFVWWVQGLYGSGVDEFVFEECKDFTSMEQLWLAFVMSELYQKLWSGTDWVKESGNA